MTKLLAKAGNNLLTRLLPPVEAGACVPERGKCCPGTLGYYFDCNGICRPTVCACRWYPPGQC